jgi:hypothetical protein
MGIEYIKDGNGQIIGQKRGNIIVRNGKQIARFDEDINRTRRMDGSIFGMGDQTLGALQEEMDNEGLDR